jgi:hypothetical protein
MGRISDWLDNFLMGGDEGKFVDVSSIEQKIDIDKHLEAGRLRIEQARKENKIEEEAEEGLKFVIDGAKLKCDLCTVPEGDLKVNFDTPTIQDKKVATVVEKDMKSLIFKGNCKKSPQSSSPCASVMKLADWKNVGTVYFQDEFPLLLKSTIKCEYGGVDIKITDCAQRNEVEKIDTTGAPVPDLEKRIVEMHWTYGNTKLADKSRFYVDMNLVVKTINYKEGESVAVCIKSEDGQPLTDELNELNLTQNVGKNNIVIFEKVLKDYTLNLLEVDDKE